MNATFLLASYTQWLLRAGKKPDYHIRQATALLRDHAQERDIYKTIARRSQNKTKSYVHTLELLELFLKKKKVDIIRNDLPTIREIKKKAWKKNRLIITERYRKRKLEPVRLPLHAIKRILPILPHLEASLACLLCLQGLKKREILRLNIKDLNLQQRTIIIDNSKKLLFSTTAHFLTHYLVGLKKAKRKKVFTMSPRSFHSAVKRIAEALHIDPYLLTSTTLRQNILQISWKLYGAAFTLTQFEVTATEMATLLPQAILRPAVNF